ncbi:MAG: hypothetical protein AAGB22_02185, partial [Bacteroidota bacterium]
MLKHASFRKLHRLCADWWAQVLVLYVLAGGIGMPAAEAQFDFFGSAASLGNDCYRITPALGNQAGAVYDTTGLDLNQPFDFRFTVNLGNNNGGADGMAFVLRHSFTPANGQNGGGLGVGGLDTTVTIEFDTWQNAGLGDPTFDHIAITSNGVNSHTAATNLAGPIQAALASINIEDGQDHDVRITWDPVNQDLEVYFDCDLRLSYTGNIIQNVFFGNPNVFWGFVGSTGGAVNLQSFCVLPFPVSFENAFSDTIICAGDSVQLDVGDSSLASYDWNNGGSLSDSTIADPVAFPTSSTSFVATVTYACTDITDTVQVNILPPTPVDLGMDSAICTGDSVVLDAFDAAYTAYQWQNGTTNSDLTVMATTTASVVATDTNGCETRDTAIVTVYPFPSPMLGGDTTICPGTSLQLNAQFAGATYLWDDNSTQSTRTASQPGLYWVTVDNNGCAASDTIDIQAYPASSVELGNDTLLCNNSILVLNATVFNGTYAWQDGTSSPTYLVSAPGQYSVTATNVCGVYQDTISVDYEVTPNINLGNDTVLCTGSFLTLDASFSRGSYLWNNGTTLPNFTVTTGGTYSVATTNPCGVDRDTITVSVDDSLMVDLGPDFSGCQGDSLPLSTQFPASTTLLWNTGHTGPDFTIQTTGRFFLLAINSCGTFSDTVSAFFRAPPTVDLGNDTTICAGEGFLLSDPNSSNIDAYLWQDGSTTSDIFANATGVYTLQVFNSCGAAQDAINVSLQPLPEVDLGNDVVICGEEESATFSVPEPNLSLRWSTGETTPEITTNVPGIYRVTATDGLGCASSDVVVVDE